ncbi:hypothetical protein [Ruegeria meonggei]|uniref:hypothetical protein n=1 Tax=Ruegeria meonggei TaxID=1446476 RepID=UPI0036704B54
MTEPRPRIYHLLGNLLTFHAFPSETGDRCAIVEIKTAPGAGAPPNHHAGEDESFYVLDGEFEFFRMGRQSTSKVVTSSKSRTAQCSLLLVPGNSLAGYFA